MRSVDGGMYWWSNYGAIVVDGPTGLITRDDGGVVSVGSRGSRIEEKAEGRHPEREERR